MDPLIDIIWGNEDDDVIGTYGDPLINTTCLTSCSHNSYTCCSCPPPFNVETQGQLCAC